VDRIITQPNSTLYRILLTAGALVLVLAGLKYTAPFWNMVFLSLILTATFAPIVESLKSRGLPAWLAIALMLLIQIGLLVIILWAILYAARIIQQDLPQLQADFQQKLAQIGASSLGSNPTFSAALAAAQQGSVSIVKVLSNALGKFQPFLFVIFFTPLVTTFMLVEFPRFQERWLRQFNPRHPMVVNITNYAFKMRQFIVVTTLLGLVKGTLAAIALYLLGVPYAAFFGVLFWLVNYIPYLGIWIAVIPPMIIAWLTLGPSPALWVLIIYTIIQTITNVIILPRVMSQVIDISLVVGLLGLLFWSYPFGIFGFILSYPYTLFVKDVLLASSDNTRWVADLISGSSKSETPHSPNPADLPVSDH
jgi:predicted PurR-regulated permease PerM